MRLFNCYHFQLWKGMLLRSFTGYDSYGFPPKPSEGLVYVVPVNPGWAVVALRYADQLQEIDHTCFWQDFICAKVAREWCLEVHQRFDDLRDILKAYPYGFPRLRVTLVEGFYHIYHGSDVFASRGKRRHLIEDIFGIHRKVKWIEDDHEHCLLADKTAVRRVLELEEDWPAR